ncbi:MAG: hypothetical protein JWP12_3353 [Bacteroidetes bacterium]|nr:hypothetical protein [Bacteroidota bacterium]
MNRKLLLLIAALCLFMRLPLSAQAPNYLWAKKAGGTLGDRAQSVCTDAAGNVIIVGWGKRHHRQKNKYNKVSQLYPFLVPAL